MNRQPYSTVVSSLPLIRPFHIVTCTSNSRQTGPHWSLLCPCHPCSTLFQLVPSCFNWFHPVSNGSTLVFLPHLSNLLHPVPPFFHTVLPLSSLLHLYIDWFLTVSLCPILFQPISPCSTLKCPCSNTSTLLPNVFRHIELESPLVPVYVPSCYSVPILCPPRYPRSSLCHPIRVFIQKTTNCLHFVSLCWLPIGYGPITEIETKDH